AARQGATVVVLDDAFQHRRVRRALDIVLISADRWGNQRRLLPAGPWREPLVAARRAHLLIVTRKAASDEQVDAVHVALAAAAPNVPRLSVAFNPGALVSSSSAVTQPVSEMSGREVCA